MIHLSVVLPSLLPIAICALIIWLTFVALVVFIQVRTGSLRDLKYVAPAIEALVPHRRPKKDKK